MSYIAGVANIIQHQLINNGKVLKGEADCKDIQLKGKYVILQLDGNQFKQNVLNTIYQAGKQRCICDYVIVSEDVVLICELKSNNEGQMRTQLKNTGKFVKFILEMVKVHNNIGAQIPTIKYVYFAANIVNKQTTNAKLEGIPWEGTQLFRLGCNSFYYLNQFN